MELSLTSVTVKPTWGQERALALGLQRRHSCHVTEGPGVKGSKILGARRDLREGVREGIRGKRWDFF